MSLKLPKSIANLDMSDIGDNLLYYHYNVKHIMKLDAKGVDKESPNYLSAYRSFEGAVYENYLYEKLLLFAKENPQLGNFLLKGPHAKNKNSHKNALHVSNKGQIIYKTRSTELGEFDALFFSEKKIIFVEMTLIKSVTNLKRRLRKKKALLEILFPHHQIEALIILNKTVSGSKQLPKYCTVWLTKLFDAKDVYTWLKSNPRVKRKPFIYPKASNLVDDDKLKTHPFRYYNTLTWMMHSLRSKPNSILNVEFLKTEKCTRYIDLFTKVYIGYMDKKDFQNLYPTVSDVTDKIAVAIEKEHTGRLFLTYFMQYSRKNLVNVVIKSGKPTVVKKDPFGVSVTEVFHILREIDVSFKITIKNIHVAEKLLLTL